MFKWGSRYSKQSSYDPKSSKMPSPLIQDDRYSPVAYQTFPEKPRKRSFLSRFSSPEKRATTPIVAQPVWQVQQHPSPEMMHARPRQRTMSTPSRHIEAPKPIRPHPSQGPFIPLMEAPDRIRTTTSFRGPSLAPIGGTTHTPSTMFRPSHSPRVPSASYLEEQSYRHMRQQPVVAVDLAPPPFRENPRLAEHRQRLTAAAQRTGASFRAVPSKAYLEDQKEREEEQNRRNRSYPSRQPPEIPIKTAAPRAWRHESEAIEVKVGPQEKKAPAKPLKPALKKSSTYTPTPVLKSALKPRAYQSDDEGVDNAVWRAEGRNTGVTVVMQPSKAFYENQDERQNGTQTMQRSKSRSSEIAPVPVAPLRQAPVHEIPASAFVSHSSSGSSGSSDSSVAQERDYRRSRRVSQTSQHENRQSMIQPSSYTQPYIKPQAEQTPRLHQHATPMQHSQSMSSRYHTHTPQTPAGLPSHPSLTWPLLEYDGRRRLPHPLLYFDVGLDPTRNKFALKVKKGPVFAALSEQERLLPATDPPTNEFITIVNGLGMWPVTVVPSRQGEMLTVFDVFYAIYTWYSHPLTQQEKEQFGHEYLRRCESAFRDRIRRDVAFDHQGEAKGMLRIDMLMGRRLFKGLIPNTKAGYPRCFEIQFDDVPPQTHSV